MISTQQNVMTLAAGDARFAVFDLTTPELLRPDDRTPLKVSSSPASPLGIIAIAPSGFWGPVALAIIGGLVSDRLVTLAVLPGALSLLMQQSLR